MLKKAILAIASDLRAKGRRAREETILRELFTRLPRISTRDKKILDKRAWSNPNEFIYDRRVLIWGEPKCVNCGKYRLGAFLKKIPIVESWPRFCSIKCGNSDETTLAKRRATSLRKYGTLYPNQNADVRGKIKATSRRLWLDDDYANEIKDKRRATSRSRYGVDYPNQTDKMRRHLRRKHLSEEVIAKKQATNLERYGAVWSSQNNKIARKIRRKIREALPRFRRAYLAKYGVANPAQRLDVREKMVKSQRSVATRRKIRRTNKDRYGVPYASQNPRIKAKTMKTERARYGGHHSSLPQTKDKIRRTNIARYGGPGAAIHPDVQDKMRETSRKNWGTDYPTQNPDVARRARKACYDKSTFRYKGKRYSGVMGYEPFAIRWLVDRGYTVDVKTDTYRYRSRGKVRVYIPDMLATRGGIRITVEVKSTYTMGLSHCGLIENESKYRSVRKKARAVLSAGDAYLLLLVSNKEVIPYFGVPSAKGLKRKIVSRRRKSRLA